jgi:REP element-mobilizing transposase RayT
MARKLRVEYPGAIYHVMNRGDRREPIFLDDADRQRFVETLAEACAKTGWQIHVYVLMPNHFHLVVETPQPNLVAGMKWFLGTYTSRFNRRHKLSGHLFAGRYKSLIVDGSGNGYLRSVCGYVHLNPARVRGRGMLPVDQPLKHFAWSSWPAYLLAQMREGIGAEHYGEERAQTAEAMAEQIIAEELKRRRWNETALKRRLKGDPAKVKLAARLRAETTMTVDWIAQRLGMGSRGYLNHLLYRQRKSGRK